MSQEQIKYKRITAKIVGSNVVNFRLEDGTLVKIFVEMNRAGIAIDRKAPDGSPLYNFEIGTRMDIQTKEGTFYAPQPPMPIAKVNNPKNEQDYTR